MSRRHVAVSVIALAITSVVACSGKPGNSDSASPAPVLQTSGQPEELTYASSLKVDLTLMTRTSSGLYYQDLLVGNGEVAAAGRRVQVGYTGWLADGAMFDQSPPGRPYAFLLGRRQVIDGWDEGVSGMRVGGRRLLVIPPALAYGRQSPGAGIPPYATLVFDVRLIRVQ
jgi:FKBP-type peptidyl-prolyl cis-trans isomerase FkpA